MEGIYGQAVLQGKGTVEALILFEDGVIKEIYTELDAKVKLAAIDSKINIFTVSPGKVIVPGFIDSHVHGANNSDCMYPSFNDLHNIAQTLAKEGVSSFLATTMTQTEANIDAALKNISDYIEKDLPTGARVLGVHLEGPFISKKYKGAQVESSIVPCDVKQFQHYQKSAGGNIKKVTLAYEENGAELTEYLKKQKIVASIGHSDATAKQVLEGAKKGLSCCTHFYNAMKPLHHREAGVVGGVLISPNIYAELICDLIHVSAEAIKVVYNAKGPNKIILVTDGIEAKHLPDGKYALGGQDVFVKEGAARLVDGTLAGSTLKLNEGVRNIKRTLGLSLPAAVALATLNVAKSLGVSKARGTINVGSYADFAVIDDEINVYKTIREGKTIYEK